MLNFSESLKVFVAVEACDMRKGFNGLHALVSERLGEDLKQGALFVFSNRRHTRIKIICFDGTGIWVLCDGSFTKPSRARPRSPVGSSTKSRCFTKSKRLCASSGLDLIYGPPSVPTKAIRL